MSENKIERIESVVVGGGQAGLAVGYHLACAGRQFVILDERARVGDAWRERWDSLRLFSPAFADSLPGRPQPGPDWSFPTKDEIASYLESYAADLALPVRLGERVIGLERSGDGFVVRTSRGRIEADNVVVATGHDRAPAVPALSTELDPTILQLHSSEYRRPSQLRAGSVLVVGAGNSGAEIALELAATHRTFLSGRLRRAPVGPSRSLALTRVIWPIVNHVLTIDTPIGRRMQRKLRPPRAPVERVRRQDLEKAGVELVARTTRSEHGWPVLEDGRTMDVANVIWCTGYRAGLEWIDIPILDEEGEPTQKRGVVDGVPGLYFVGRFFQYAFVSSFLGGVGRDAGYVVKLIAARMEARERAGAASVADAATGRA